MILGYFFRENKMKKVPVTPEVECPRNYHCSFLIFPA